MMLELYSNNGIKKCDIAPGESDRCDKSLMGDHVLMLSFTIDKYVEIDVGDYIDCLGERYYALALYRPEQQAINEYVYRINLHNAAGKLRFAKVIRPGVDGELSFSYDAKAIDHVKIIVDNMNRITASADWTVGTVVSSENKNIEYNNIYCLDALSDIAKVFDTEYWIEGHTINLCRCEHSEPIQLGYMSGLISLTRTENDAVKHFTRLYPVGSTRNIDRAKYGYSRLQLPGGEKYVQRNIHLGIIEQSEEQAFAHIYPRYTGTVSDIRHEKRIGTDGKEFEVYYFKDSAIPFNPNDYEIAGLVKKVVFQSGELNGRDFDVNYNASQKEWEIITQFPYENQQLPGGKLIPRIGDMYIPYNFRMPDEYVHLAEKELKKEVDAYMAKISEDTSVYKAHTDYIDLDARNIDLKIGQRVMLVDDQLFASEGGKHASRITRVSRSVLYPGDADVEFTYAVDKGRFQRLENDLVKIHAAYREVSDNMPSILKSWDSADMTEYNVLSSLRTVKTIQSSSLSKIAPDGTDYPLWFKSIGSKDYAPGVAGWQIKDGKMELDELVLRKSLTVPELIYNRVSYLSGEKWLTWAGGHIEAVKKLNGTSGIITERLHEGERMTVREGDTCKAIYHTGNGFTTIQWTVTQLIDDSSYKYTLRQGMAQHPVEGCDFAQVGSLTDASRRGGRRITPRHDVIYDNCAGWDISIDMIRSIRGDLSEFRIPGYGQLQGYGTYDNNAYISGRLRTIRAGETKPRPVPIDMGVWTPGISKGYYMDMYHFAGSTWLCVDEAAAPEAPVTADPATNVPAWQLFASKGADGAPALVNLIADGSKKETIAGTDDTPYKIFSRPLDKIISNADCPTCTLVIKLRYNPAPGGALRFYLDAGLYDSYYGWSGLKTAYDGTLVLTFNLTAVERSVFNIYAVSRGAVEGGNFGSLEVDWCCLYEGKQDNPPTVYMPSRSDLKGDRGLSVRPNLCPLGGWEMLNNSENDVCTFQRLPNGQFKASIVKGTMIYTYGSVLHRLTSAKHIVCSIRIIDSSKPVLDDGLHTYSNPTLAGDLLWFTYADSAYRCFSSTIRFQGGGAPGDWVIFDQPKIEVCEDEKEAYPTAYIPHVVDLKGEPGVQGLQGKDGKDGIPGAPGKDGRTSYTHIAYADNAQGGGFSQTPGGKAYIGMYVDFVQSDSTDPAKYRWSLIKGTDGQNGTPGAPGKDGRTPYLHIAYANSADGRKDFHTVNGEGKAYIGQYTDYTQQDSSDPSRYKWSLIKGTDGADGLSVRPNLLPAFEVSTSDADKDVTAQIVNRKTVLTWTQKTNSTSPLYVNISLQQNRTYILSFVFDNPDNYAVRRYIYYGGDWYYNSGTLTPLGHDSYRMFFVIKPKADLQKIYIYGQNLQGDGSPTTLQYTDFKIEQLAPGEPELPTMFVSHPDDLKGDRGLSVRPNLCPLGGWEMLNNSENDVCTFQRLPNGQFKASIVKGTMIYTYGSVLHRLTSAKHIVCSIRIIDSSKPVLDDGLHTYSNPTLTGDLLWFTYADSAYRCFSSTIRFQGGGAPGDWVIFDQPKIEICEDEKEAYPTAYIPHIIDLKGEPGVQGLQGKDGKDGIPGAPGKDGRTSYTHIAYADNAQGGGFSQTPGGKAYIGMYVDFVQSDSTDPAKYRWSLIKGTDGQNGTPGAPGKDGRTPYLHIAYANSADGRKDFHTVNGEGKAYIGQYVDYVQSDSTNPASYMWSKIKGEDGRPGKDVTPEEAAAQIEEKLRRMGMTEIDGGVMLSNMLQLRKTDNSTVTAGVSGVQGANKDLPSFWSGGTYAAALQNLVNILFRHDGYARLGLGDGSVTVYPDGRIRIGQLHLNGSGELEARDSNGTPRLVFNSKEIDTLSALIDQSDYNQSSQTDPRTMSNNTARVELGRFGCSKDSVKMTVSGGISITSDGIDALAFGVCRVWMVNNLNNDEYELGVLRHVPDKQHKLSTHTIDLALHNMLHGQYVVYASYHRYGPASNSLYVQTMSASVERINFHLTKSTDKKRTHFGRNGFLSYTSANQFVHYSELSGLTAKGPTNLPGVLAAGTVSEYGTLSCLWGAKVLTRDAQRPEEGVFRVHHNVGHSNYNVQITGHIYSSKRWSYAPGIIYKANSYFEVLFREDDGRLRWIPFDFLIIGAN